MALDGTRMVHDPLRSYTCVPIVSRFDIVASYDLALSNYLYI